MLAKAPSKFRFPDFMIGGAMKSGTSSLHHILAQHEQIFLPAEEIHFFSRDDFFQHPRFFLDGSGGWVHQKYDPSPESLARYSRFFAPARPDQLVGEDSTIYLASARAPQRIAGLLPRIKMIFLLRDPVVRCYSQYWHLLRSGRVDRDFETVLKASPHLLLNRSLYREQLARYFSVVDRSRIKVLVFESFIQNPQKAMDEVLDFLDLPRLDLAGRNPHQNPTSHPKLLRLQYFHNLLFHTILERRQADPLRARHRQQHGSFEKLWMKAESTLRHLNSTRMSCPPMRAETKSFLEGLLARENEGLSELIGVDVSPFWPYMSGDRDTRVPE